MTIFIFLLSDKSFLLSGKILMFLLPQILDRRCFGLMGLF
jgi:hypothetical protein